MMNHTGFHGVSLRRQRGLTLVELMIGILLGLLLLTAVIYVFSGSRASHRHQESLSAVQESGRIALEVLNRDIRMAANPGCGNVSFLQHQSALFDNELAVAATPGASADDPDGITITRGSAAFAFIDSSPEPDQIQLVSAAPLGTIAVGDQLLLSDCVFTDVMTVTAVEDDLITGTGLSMQFRPRSQVSRLESVQYTVEDGQLMRAMLPDGGQAVAAGVNNLKLFYGIPSATSRSAAQYIAEPTAAEIAQAVSVKLTLTVADGPEVSQLFTSTIALRNRAP